MNHYMKKRYSNTSSSTTSEIIQMCNEGLWMKVIERINNDPNVALIQDSSSNTTYYGGDNNTTTILAIAIRNGCQCLTTLDALINANPYQLIIIHRHYGTILHELFQLSRNSNSINSTKQHSGIMIGKLALFLLQRILFFFKQQQSTQQQQQQQLYSLEKKDDHYRQHIRIFKEHYFEMIHNYEILLTSKDGMGRTILHIVAEYVIDQQGNCDDSSLQLFIEEYLKVCSSTLRMIDHDGNTPLIVLLTAMPTECNDYESYLCNMICHFLYVDPYCATISCKVSSYSFHSMCLPTHQQNKLNRIYNDIPVIDSNTNNNGITLVTNTPLYFALLHKRSIIVIKAILNCINKQSILKGKNIMNDEEIPIVTGYHETYLHICITTRAPLDIIKLILNHYPNSTLIPDMCNLTPIDWLWLCHIVDWNYNNHNEDGNDSPIPDYHYDFTTRNNNNNTYPIIDSNTNTRQQNQQNQQHVQSHRMLSRRRNLGGSLFQNWFQNAETSLLSESKGMTELCNIEDCDDEDVHKKHDDIITNGSWLQQRRRQCREKYLYQFFLERIRLILPIAGECYMRKKFDNLLCSKKWIQSSTIIHAACLIRCPMAVIHGAKLITMDDNNINLIQQKSKIDDYDEDQFNNVLNHRDMLYGRYPLHYATYRFKEYIAHYPIRPSLSYRGGIQTHYEASPIYSIIQCCPLAASYLDNDSRLPIHILIDTINDSRCEKKKNKPHDTIIMSHDDNDNEAIESQKIIQYLLDANPTSLEQRDGITKLYLWQQAAIGDYANLNIIYILLRMQPTLMNSNS